MGKKKRMAYTRSGLIWQQRTQEALRFVFKAARFGVITRRILHAQSYIYHNAYTLSLSQALNTSSVDYETSKKKKENPTASVEGQGAAIYRQVTTMQLQLLSSYYIASSWERQSWIKQYTVAKPICFSFGDKNPKRQLGSLLELKTCSADFPAICSVIQSPWGARGRGSEKSARNWAGHVLSSVSTCQGKVGVTTASSVLGWYGGIENLREQTDSQAGNI